MEGFINLFERKDKSGNKPHFSVSFKIGDVEHEAGLWQKVSPKGNTYFTGKYKPAEQRDRPAEARPAAKPAYEQEAPEDFDSIPF